jgi:hypothetical protein
VISQWWTGPDGKTISGFNQILRIIQNGPKANVQLGYTQWTTYQPAVRYWHFQLIEGGWLLALALLLVAATIWLVHRRAA